MASSLAASVRQDLAMPLSIQLEELTVTKVCELIPDGEGLNIAIEIPSDQGRDTALRNALEHHKEQILVSFFGIRICRGVSIDTNHAKLDIT